MTFLPVQTLTVKLRWKTELLTVGRLALKDRHLFFEYSPEFLIRGLDISPFMLPSFFNV